MTTTTTATLQSASLHYREGNSDKVYQAAIQPQGDGYLVTFLIDENTGTSECAILDASDLAKGPICRLALPHKICSGTHSVWVEHDQLRKDAAFHARRFALV
jgi:carotenoid cleavage dioxygenase-like enzyme